MDSQRKTNALGNNQYQLLVTNTNNDNVILTTENNGNIETEHNLISSETDRLNQQNREIRLSKHKQSNSEDFLLLQFDGESSAFKNQYEREGLFSSFPAPRTQNDLINQNQLIRGSKGESTTFAGDIQTQHMMKSNRFGYEPNNSVLLGADYPEIMTQNNGFVLSERFANSQKNQEIMRLLKSGIYSERPETDANMKTIRTHTSKNRPKSSKPVTRESRSLKRLISQTKQEDEKVNYTKNLIRKAQRSPIFKLSSNNLLPKEKQSSTKNIVHFRNGIFEVKEVLDFRALKKKKAQAKRSQPQYSSVEKITRKRSTKIHPFAVLDYEGADQKANFDPLGEMKKQDDTALALRNLIMKQTVAQSKKSHQRARIRQLKQKKELERLELMKLKKKLPVLDDSIISSEDCEDEQAIYQYMAEEERQVHILQLWKRAYNKARGGSLVLRFFNDLSRKIYLFGVSKKLEEIENEEIPNPYVIQLNSKFKSYWNMVNIILLLYTAIYMPFRIAFIDDETVGQITLDWSVDTLFFIDIIINFFSSYEESDGFIQQNLRVICTSYIRGWFAADFIACFPFQIFDLQANEITNADQKTSYQKLLRLMRLPRLYRFLKIMKVLKSIKLLHNYRWYQKTMNKLKMNGGIVRMIQGCIATVVITHLFACFWFLTAKIDDFEPNTWVARKGIVDRDNFTCYLYSLYWAMQTVITLGYGDIPAVTTWEMLLSLVWMLFGEIFYSFIVATYTGIISGQIEIDASIQLKIKSLAELSRLAEIPFELSKKIKKFIENNYEAIYNREDETIIIKMLPPSLRDEVLNNTFGEVIEKVKFFRDCDDVDFLQKILPLLAPLKIEKSDIVYWQREYAQDVFYILKGTITLYTEKGNPFVKYKSGDTLGDSDTLLNLPRDSKAMASTHLSIMYLKVDEQFERSISTLEKYLMDMILIARKKRDLHDRLMLSADQKAAKEAMIQALIADKNMLFKYVTNNERQVNILTQQIIQRSIELNMVRIQNKNLKGAVIESIKNRKKQQLAAIESYNSRHMSRHDTLLNTFDQNAQQSMSKSPVFNKLFTALKKAKDQQLQVDNLNQSDLIKKQKSARPRRNSSTNVKHFSNDSERKNKKISSSKVSVVQSNDQPGYNRKETSNEIKLVNMKKIQSESNQLSKQQTRNIESFQKIQVNELSPPKIQSNRFFPIEAPISSEDISKSAFIGRKEHPQTTKASVTNQNQLMIIEETEESLIKKSSGQRTKNQTESQRMHSQTAKVSETKQSKLQKSADNKSNNIDKKQSNAGKMSQDNEGMPDFKFEVKEKLSILDKVLISAFKKDKLVDIYQQFPFLQRVTLDNNGKDFSEKLQRMKAELMMNELAQSNDNNIENQVQKTAELIDEHVQMEMVMRERDRTAKIKRTRTKSTSSDPFVDRSKSSIKSSKTVTHRSVENIKPKPKNTTIVSPQQAPQKKPAKETEKNNSSIVTVERNQETSAAKLKPEQRGKTRRMTVSPRTGAIMQNSQVKEELPGKGQAKINHHKNSLSYDKVISQSNNVHPKKITVRRLSILTPSSMYEEFSSGRRGNSQNFNNFIQLKSEAAELIIKQKNKQSGKTQQKSRYMSPFVIDRFTATNQNSGSFEYKLAHQSDGTFDKANRYRNSTHSNPLESMQKSVSSALNQKLLRRDTLKKKFEELKSDNLQLFKPLKIEEVEEDVTSYISIQDESLHQGTNKNNIVATEPEAFEGYYNRSLSKKASDSNSAMNLKEKGKSRLNEAQMAAQKREQAAINQIHNHVNREMQKKIQETVTIQSAVPAVRQNNHQPSNKESRSHKKIKVDVIEDQIDFVGNSQLEGLAHFNADMGHVSLNVFETYTVFDLINKQNQNLVESLTFIESQNQKIDMHQSTIDYRLDELEFHLMKLKELKGNKRLQLGFSVGKKQQQ